MKNSTLIHDLTPEEITSLFEGFRTQIVEDIKQNFTPKVPTEYLTRTEVAEMFKCDISTVHNWTVKGKLKAYGIGNRVYYKRSEVEVVLLPLGKKNGGSVL